MAEPPEQTGFFSRWSRRKEEARAAEALVEAPVPVVEAPAEPVPVAEEEKPALTLDDVARLHQESDFSPFVAHGVDDNVKQAAMKKLFSNPHFNVMDGLDTYIDDYSQPDPIPPAMLRMMNQSQFLGLFDHEKQDDDQERAPTTQAETPAVPSPEALATASHDHPDLRLQQDDASGQPAAEPGARA